MAASVLDKPVDRKLSDIRIYAHSDLLYWWPVWAVAFGMALWTYLDGHHLVLIPEGAAIENGRVVPEGTEATTPLVHMARSKVPGLLFFLTLLAVVLCTHTWLRGPWALFITASIAGVLLFISWVEWWDPLMEWFRALRIYVNLGGYLLVGVVLLVAWLVVVLFLDRRTYLVFSVGQLRCVDRLGDEEKAFDTSHVVFEKRPYDWFRRLVGLGAGDMVIRIGGTQPQLLELKNVICVGRRLQNMEARLRTKGVV